MRYHLLVASFALALSPTVCLAQGSTAAGAASGAIVGGVVGGPVGAIVGGTVGATVGSAAEPPAEVRSYVIEEQAPSVRVEREVVVGEPLPPTVELRVIPKHTRYRYAIVNGERVIVDSGSRKVIEIVR